MPCLPAYTSDIRGALAVRHSRSSRQDGHGGSSVPEDDRLSTVESRLQWPGGITQCPVVGERIAFYRQRRGYTQEVLAGLVGRSTDWLVVLGLFGSFKRSLDLLVCAVLATVDRLGVEAEEHGDAVSGAAGDFGRGDP